MRRLASFILLILCILLATADHQALAEAEQPDDIVRLLERYKQVLETSNPMLLLSLQSPGSRLFDRILSEDRFDNVRTCRVNLSDVLVEEVDQGLWTIGFLRTTEELFRNGLFVRSRHRVELELMQPVDGAPVIRGHRIIPADDAELPDLHPAEKSMLVGMANWRRGGLDAERFWDTLTSLETDGSPDFMMGDRYFRGQLSYFLALSVLQEESRSQAYAHLRNALEVHPDFPLAMNLLARLHFEDSQPEEALRLWSRSLELNPDQGDVAALAAHLGEALGTRDKEVREAMMAAIDAPPSTILETLPSLLKKHRRSVALALLAARTHLAAGDPATALDGLEKLRRSRWNAATHYLAGRALLLLNKPVQALAEFRKVWELQPGYRDSLTWLVEIPTARAQWMEARAFAEDGLRLKGPQTAALHARIGIIDYRQGRDYEATAHLKAGLEQGLPARLRSTTAITLRMIGSDRR